MTAIHNSPALGSVLRDAGLEPRIVAAMMKNAKPLGEIAADNELGALVKRTGKDGVAKFSSARLKNWLFQWRTMLFDVAPALATATTSPFEIVRILGLLKGLKRSL